MTPWKNGIAPARVRRYGPFLWLVLAMGACRCDDQLESLIPEFAVSPAMISQTNLCSSRDFPVTIKNNGKGDLVISALTIEGGGWVVVPVPLPLTVKRNDQTEIVLRSTGGDAVLTITSNDPVNHAVKVTLHSTANQPPKVAIKTPTQGQVIDENADLELTGTVSDDSDAPNMLSIQWIAGTATVLSTASATAAGMTSYDWPAANRMVGTQSVTLKATDSCGATASVTVSFCQDSTYSYSPFNLQGWQYDGDTLWDATNDRLQITNATTHQEGSAFQTSQMVNGDHVDISFQFYSSDGSGADGMALVALDTTRYGGSLIGADGCGMGFGADPSCSPGNPLPGWAVEIDTYYNSEVDQTPENHTAFAFDGSLATEPAWAALPNIRDGNWHQMSVNVAAPQVTVTVDGTTYINQTITGNFNFPAFVGFTGSTGGDTDDHYIKALDVTGHTCTMMPMMMP
jgi:hypothetical protein